MPESRFFIDSELLKGAQVTLDNKESHHATAVMRKKVHDSCELVNGEGVLAHASVISSDKRSICLEIDSVYQKAPNPNKMILVQALPRLNRLEFITEKGTELGMDEMWLFAGMQSEKKTLSENQKQRIRHIAICAMKQCGRLYLPKIHLFPSLFSFLPSKIEGDLYFGDTASTAPSFSSVFKPSRLSLFVVGPESGFTEKEVSHLKELKAKGVHLHNNILRTDTASLVALSYMSLSAK